MDGDQGAINKFEHGEFSAGVHDLVVSAEKLLGRVESDAAKAAALALKTFVGQFSTPFGVQALQLAGTAIASLEAGQSVPQVAAAVEPQIAADVVADANAAGIDTAKVLLDAARVHLSAAAAPMLFGASTGAQAGTTGDPNQPQNAA